MPAATEVQLITQKRACLIYVEATAARRDKVKSRLIENGYSVCEVKAELDDALAAQAGQPGLPAALSECIAGSELCVFLLPEAQTSDCLLDSAAGLSNQLGKRIVGVVAGAREKYPRSFDDNAAAMVREGSARLDDAICGAEVWERPDRSQVADRPIKHIRCQ